MKKILILSISLLFLVVACEINGDSALIGDVETDNKISELEKKIEVLERKTRHLTMISEINNGFSLIGSNSWFFESEDNLNRFENLQTEQKLKSKYPLTFDEFLELEDEKFNLIFKDLEGLYLKEIERPSSSGGGISDMSLEDHLDEMKHDIEMNKD